MNFIYFYILPAVFSAIIFFDSPELPEAMVACLIPGLNIIISVGAIHYLIKRSKRGCFTGHQFSEKYRVPSGTFGTLAITRVYAGSITTYQCKRCKETCSTKECYI